MLSVTRTFSKLQRAILLAHWRLCALLRNLQLLQTGLAYANHCRLCAPLGNLPLLHTGLAYAKLRRS